MLRLMPSGRVGSTTSFPSVTIQPFPSAATLMSCGRSSFTRTSATSRTRFAVALLMAFPCSAFNAEMATVASVSKTIQTTSARRKTAAGVGAVNGNAMLRLSPLRLSTARMAPPADPASCAAASRGGDAGAAAGVWTGGGGAASTACGAGLAGGLCCGAACAGVDCGGVACGGAVWGDVAGTGCGCACAGVGFGCSAAGGGVGDATGFAGAAAGAAACCCVGCGCAGGRGGSA